MPIQFTVYPIARLVGYLVRGLVTEAEARAFLTAILSHPQFRRGFDFLGVRGTAGGSEMVYQPTIAREVRSLSTELGPCRWAVVTHSPLGADTVRRWLKLVPAEAVEVVPFLAKEDAIDWLAQDGASIDQRHAPHTEGAGTPARSPSFGRVDITPPGSRLPAQPTRG